MILQITERENILRTTEEQDRCLKENEQLFMIWNGELIEKPKWELVVDITHKVVTISNLPTEPYELFVDMGESVGMVPVTEPQFELVDPGEYAIILKPSFPFAEERHHVEVV